MTTARMIIPDRFRCPLTLQVMVDPVTTVHGHTFERDALLHYLELYGQCPFTTLPLNPSYDMKRNLDLQDQIMEWTFHTSNVNHQVIGITKCHNVYDDELDILGDCPTCSEHPLSALLCNSEHNESPLLLDEGERDFLQTIEEIEIAIHSEYRQLVHVEQKFSYIGK